MDKKEKEQTEVAISWGIDCLLEFCEKRGIEVIGTLLFCYDDETFIEKIDTTDE